jgi:spore germination cell wall hydrolase CwlJ-like protein
LNRQSPALNYLAVLVALALAACGAMSAVRHQNQAARIASEAGAIDPAGLLRLQRGMAPASFSLARRFDPLPNVDAWDRPQGWTSLELDKAPGLSFGSLTFADAAQLNAALPTLDAALTPAQPFFLQASGPERERAVLCMTQAIYYEAALEPREGQEAVAQTVINRMRHPDFPKSICGVVYEGSSQATGCQFSFTCDGSRDRPPIEPYWGRAREVAEAALSGYVARDIGPATHYHADYVFPRWGPQMVKIVQLGAHIFYRFPGPIGAPAVLSGRYAGGELRVSMAGPSPAAILAAKAAGAQASPEPGQMQLATLTPPPPTSPTDLRPRTAGQMIYGRRIPSKEEIARIDAQLAPMAKDDGPMATAGADSNQ